jgi:hypothetical protein
MKATSQQAQDSAAVAALEKRVKELETELKAIMDLKGIPGQVGPRGPAGDILAAVARAGQTVADAEACVQYKADTTYAKFADDVAALRREVAETQRLLDERIQNVVDGHTVQVLRDYHLLDENHQPAHWSMK